MISLSQIIKSLQSDVEALKSGVGGGSIVSGGGGATARVIDRIALGSSTQNRLNLSNTPNTNSVVITINGFSYVEKSGVFTVDRSTKVVAWNASTAGFELNSSLAKEVFISYDVNDVSLTKVTENISVSSISNNRFNLSQYPSNAKISICINGIMYFEERGDFSVSRSDKVVQWNSTKTGFSIDSTLHGYLTITYEADNLGSQTLA